VKAFTDWLLALGPAGVFLFAIIDGAGVPTPGGMDALLIFLCAQKPGMWPAMAGLATCGSIIGCMILFTVAQRGGEAYVAKHTASGRGARFREWFQHYGLLTVFIPALVPIPMPLKIFVLCSGGLGISRANFIRVLLAARIPRYFALAWLGAQLGAGSWRWILAHTPHLLAFAVILFVFLYALVKYADYRRAQVVD
jgi:membrane protein YqaA with SNARE-associated domain